MLFVKVFNTTVRKILEKLEYTYQTNDIKQIVKIVLRGDVMTGKSNLCRYQKNNTVTKKIKNYANINIKVK
jgi:hypothetical protein